MYCLRIFLIFSQFIFRDLNELEGAIIIGHINKLRYVNDHAVISKSESNLQTIVKCVQDKNSQAGLYINVSQIKTMLISRNNDGKTIKVNGTTLKQVEQFLY